jgi:hypothetical protein
MLVTAAALSTPLVAQTRSPSWVLGLAATVGSGWQFEGADFGVVRPAKLGLMRYWSIAGRFGTFQDEGAFVFGSRGFVAGVALATQTGPLPIFEVGSEQNPIKIALDLTLETSGYLASNSPFPQGGHWLGLALLPGVRTVQTDAFGASFMIGPVLFIGKETDVRTFLGFRIEIPLAAPPRAP